MDHSRSTRRLGMAALALIAALALGACSSGSSSDGSADGSGDTTTAPTADETTSITADPAEGGGDLVGDWTVDAGDLLQANTANLETAGLPDCSGPVTLSLNDDGTFSQAGSATCSMASLSATATFSSSGTYEVDGDTLRISTAEDAGTIEIAGASQPLSGGLGDGEAQFSVDGDTLTITYTEASVGTITQTYTRA